MQSALFVDDEADVLKALRFALYRDRSRWDLVFVEGGAQALELIETRSFAVVISDLNMPKMDGVELLSRVRALQPTARRVILTGNVEQTVTERAHDVVDEFLGKPCPTATMRECLERWLHATTP